MIVEFLVALIGLGVAIDYSLLVVVRWREERAHGLDGDEAVVRAMETAGRAVVFSGTTVAIGLLAMIVLPLPFLRSIGYAGMLIPLISVVVAVTLLPVVLRRSATGSTGRTCAATTRPAARGRAGRGSSSGAAGSPRRRGADPRRARDRRDRRCSPGRRTSTRSPSTATRTPGLVALERSGIGAGALEPIEVLTPAAADAAARRGALRGVAGVHGAFAGRRAVAACRTRGRRRDPGRRRLDLGRARHDQLASATRPTTPARTSASAGIGAENADFISAIYGSFPLMIAIIAVLTFLLLARAFRSLLLPLKAVVLNVISVAAAWGVITLVWQQGHGSNALWGIGATHSVTVWIPLMVFAFLFGLSMDYEVFILARMREEYDRTGSTDAAVVRGIGRTGRLVTSAALILFLAFVSMASGPRDRHQGVRDRPGGRDPARRHRDPGAAGAGGRVAVRALELVAAGAAGEVAAGRPLAARAGRRGGLGAQLA